MINGSEWNRTGNPCKVIRHITEEDHEYWKKQYDEYNKMSGDQSI